jgi:hypothetical protein
MYKTRTIAAAAVIKIIQSRGHAVIAIVPRASK